MQMDKVNSGSRNLMKKKIEKIVSKTGLWHFNFIDFCCEHVSALSILG